MLLVQNNKLLLQNQSQTYFYISAQNNNLQAGKHFQTLFLIFLKDTGFC